MLHSIHMGLPSQSTHPLDSGYPDNLVVRQHSSSSGSLDLVVREARVRKVDSSEKAFRLVMIRSTGESSLQRRHFGTHEMKSSICGDSTTATKQAARVSGLTSVGPIGHNSELRTPVAPTVVENENEKTKRKGTATTRQHLFVA